MWRRRGKAVSAGLSEAPYSAHHGLYSEAVASSVASAVVLVDLGRFREAVVYVQRAAKALYAAAKEAFEKVKVTVQRLVELFVEAVTRVLTWVDEHKAYLFLTAAAAAGAVALSVALNLRGLVELEKLAYAVSVPFVAGLADTGGRAAERFGVVAERWRVDDNEKQKIEEVINEVINAPLKGERPFSKLTRLENLPKPLVELRRALKDVKDEVVQDAAVVAALVLYKTLINNAGAYREWAELYKWARGLVEEQEFTVAAGKIRELREAHNRMEGVAGRVLEELNSVLALYASHSRDLYEKLRPHLEVDFSLAEELAEAREKELSKYSNANMGTKAYAALLSIARGGIYGHAAMLLIEEGSLADIVLLTPIGAYDKAKDVAKERGESVDPSRSPKGAVDWKDRAASVLLWFLIKYGETDLKFRRVEKGGRKGFQVFRTFGGVEAPVGELWIGKTAAYFKVSKEELGRLVEEAKRTAPDLSGLDKAPQYLEWRATDVSSARRQIEASTVHPWQLRWYIALLGEPKSFCGSVSVAKEGIKPAVTARWPRESEDKILKESRWLESLLGRRVENWRQLVDAIDWSWVVKKVEELADELKPWIGPERASDAEREGLARRMLGELVLFVHFAEARRGMDDGRWREERAKSLAKAVEDLSGGRIRGEYAERLAKQIIYYAEGYKKEAEERINNLAEEVGVSSKEVWGIVEFVLSDVYCLARDCARDEVVRKFVAPALELIMLDKALRGEFDREEALLIFGEMYATAVAGDGHVGPGKAELTVGGELGGGAALPRLATLHLLNRLLPDELKFDARIYMSEDGYYRIASHGGDAARFKRLLAVSAPSAGGEYLSEKFEEFVKDAQIEVRLDKNSIRQTKRGLVAADLTISEGDVAVKYNVYQRRDILLQFRSTDRSRGELAARLLRLAGVDAKVKKEVGGRGEWYVVAFTDMLAAGREELRSAIAEVVKKAVEKGWVDASKAERWLKKLERGVTLKEGWPMYNVRLTSSGALEIRFSSPNLNSIQREVQRLKEMGLEEGKHFSVKMPEGNKKCCVSILRKGLEHAAWLSVRGKDEQQRSLAAAFVERILRRAEDAGKKVYEKAREIIEEGKTRGSLKLEDFEKKVEVNGKTYIVKVRGGEAVEEKQNGRKLLRIRIKAEVGRVEGEHTIVDRVVREYTITYGRRGVKNVAEGRAYVRADVAGGREADAERLAAVIKALTGREPWIRRKSDGKIEVMCYEGHLKGFMRYDELADDIEKWLEETSR